MERGTHACKASKLGPVERWWTQDGKLGITIEDPPPESGRRTLLLYFTYSYCILSRVWKLATSLLVLRYYKHLFLFSMLKLHVTSSRFCSYLLDIYHFTYTFSHAHTKAHTHKHTCTISTQEDGDNQAQEPGWERRKKGFVRALAYTQTIFTNLKKRFELIKLPVKLLDYFLRSDKSNINQ